MRHWLDKVIELLESETADLRELARIAGGDPQVFYRGIDISEVDTTGQNIEGMQFGDVAVTPEELAKDFQERVTGIGRQEERLCLLLAAIARDKSNAHTLIESFPQKTIYERRAVAYFKRIGGLTASEYPWQLNAALVTAANGIYQLAFSQRRGLLLLYMSVHLGHLPALRDFIRRKMNRSHSHYVRAYQPQVEEILTGIPAAS